MVTEVVEIVVRERGAKATSRSIGRIGRTARRAATAVGALAVGLATFTAARGIVRYARAAVETAAAFESLEVRLRGFLGSQEEANAALENFIQLSSETPFAVQQIVGGAASLASAALGNRERLEELTGIAANIAAQSGLTFQQAAENLSRSLQAGIGAADLFRERGVRPLIEELEGIPDATQATARELEQAFRNVFGSGGVFGTAARDLSLTLGGALSNIEDAAINARAALGDALSPVVIRTATEVLIPALKQLRESFVDNEEDARNLFALITSTGLQALLNLARVGINLGQVFVRVAEFTRDLLGTFAEAQIQALEFKRSLQGLDVFGLFTDPSDWLATTQAIEQARATVDGLAVDVAKSNAESERLRGSLQLLEEQLKLIQAGISADALAKPIEDAGQAAIDFGNALDRTNFDALAAIASRGDQTDEQRDALGQLIDLQRDLNRAAAAEKGERAAAIFDLQEQIQLARDLAEIAGQDPASNAVVQQLEAQLEELRGGTLSIGENLAASLTGALDGAFTAAIRQGASFTDALANGLEAGAQQALIDGIGAGLDVLQGQLEKVFDEVFDELPIKFEGVSEEMGNNIQAAVGAALSFALQTGLSALLGGGGGSQSSSAAGVESAVTSTEAVRGIVAGPQEIAVAQVGNNLAQAMEPVRALLEIANAQRADIRRILRSGSAAGSSLGEELDDVAFRSSALNA